LTTNGDPGWVSPLHGWFREHPKGGGAMSARIQALLIVLGTIALAALNASSPWGP
jgi:hypothetical protein